MRKPGAKNKQPSKKELRDQILQLTTELTISRESEMNAKQSLNSTSERLIEWKRKAEDSNNVIADLGISIGAMKEIHCKPFNNDMHVPGSCSICDLIYKLREYRQGWV